MIEKHYRQQLLHNEKQTVCPFSMNNEKSRGEKSQERVIVERKCARPDGRRRDVGGRKCGLTSAKGFARFALTLVATKTLPSTTDPMAARAAT
jgi:hypothetical protein